VAKPEVFREVERKLEVNARFRVPDLAAAVPGVAATAPQKVLKLSATYYDTADLRLARSHVTLRRRVGGTDDGWHLKLPVVPKVRSGKQQASARDELHVPLTDGVATTTPPVQLVQMVTALTRGAPVRPVATLRNERRPLRLLDADGALIAELTDDRVTVLRKGIVTERFRELEVEASPHRVHADLDDIVAALVAAGAKESSFPSKAARALGEHAAAPPDIPKPKRARPDQPAARAVQAHLARHAAALVRADLWVRRDMPDGVHQMRVAARQLRSGLKVFTPLLDKGWADRLRDELGWLADELAGARDGEVLEQRLREGLARLDVEDDDLAAALALVHSNLADDAGDAGERVQAAMNSPRYLRLLEALVVAANDPALSQRAQRPSSEVLPPLAVKAWKRLRADADRLRRKDPDDEWHAVRLRAKRTRYALDALTPVFGDPARAWAEQVAVLTDLLGTHQDAALAAESALAIGAGVTGPVADVFTALHDQQREQIVAVRKEFLKVWPAVSRTRRRGWLR
jgi:inorganic triphosphatase YgiF